MKSALVLFSILVLAGVSGSAQNAAKKSAPVAPQKAPAAQVPAPQTPAPSAQVQAAPTGQGLPPGSAAQLVGCRADVSRWEAIYPKATQEAMEAQKDKETQKLPFAVNLAIKLSDFDPASSQGQGLICELATGAGKDKGIELVSNWLIGHLAFTPPQGSEDKFKLNLRTALDTLGNTMSLDALPALVSAATSAQAFKWVHALALRSIARIEFNQNDITSLLSIMSFYKGYDPSQLDLPAIFVRINDLYPDDAKSDLMIYQHIFLLSLMAGDDATVNVVKNVITTPKDKDWQRAGVRLLYFMEKAPFSETQRKEIADFLTAQAANPAHANNPLFNSELKTAANAFLNNKQIEQGR